MSEIGVLATEIRKEMRDGPPYFHPGMQKVCAMIVRIQNDFLQKAIDTAEIAAIKNEGHGRQELINAALDLLRQAQGEV